MMQQINIRLDADLKAEIEDIATGLGLGVNDVFRVMAKKFADNRGFPFEVVYPYIPNYKPEIMKRLKDVLTDKSDYRPMTLDEFHKMLKA